jgi:GT2 family glycosyltransferase
LKLSIVIVNYNVKYFLEQALRSVLKALHGIDAEVWVVDNNSSDGSVAMVEEKFPSVKLQANKENLGFAKANNQAMRLCSGEYILLLNPDTIVEEDTFAKCIQFMDAHAEAGALGVRMIDGTGRFLPESKRSLPTPAVSFFKIFGFSALFPKSHLFGRYHLGFLAEDQTHEVEVLSGAFMLMRKSALDKVGLLDEDFFMYGEDIDLSYRIIKGGYKNYYFADTRIVHYKGESTKKGSLNYVRVFYKAMIIFAKKHFSSQQAGLYTALIYLAIVFRAVLSLFFSTLSAWGFTLIDGLLSLGGMYLMKELWENQIMHNDHYYLQIFTTVFIPSYVVVWILTTYLSGGYDKPLRINKALRGVFFGTIAIAAVFAFLPNEYRFSRTLILLGATWTGIAMLITRFFYNVMNRGKAVFEDKTIKRVLIVGNKEEGQRVLTLLNETLVAFQFLGFVSRDKTEKSSEYIGDMSMLEDLVRVLQIEELIFCAKDISTGQTISWMSRLGDAVDYKIVPEDSLSIIGSHSKNAAGDLYALDVNLLLNRPMAKRNKRLLDIFLSLLVLFCWPIFVLLSGSFIGLFKNALAVLFGWKTWVSYLPVTTSIYQLPKIKAGILQADSSSGSALSNDLRDRVNLLYARDYNVRTDLRLFFGQLKKLGS